MKRVLYITNIEAPYRLRFFNELAESCELTVLYERERSAERDARWATGGQRHYQVRYLKGRDIGAENRLSFGILRELKGYDAIVVGCYNSPSQILAMLWLWLRRKPCYLNLDGEPFLEDRGVKGWLKRFFIKKATSYLVGGEKSAASVKQVVGDRPVTTYYFSSLSAQELAEHQALAADCRRDGRILVVGRYLESKGMDIALEAARLSPELNYVFVGMADRTEQFARDYEIPKNVELIPFLSKQELERLYRSCAMLVLASRRECWGLVINEAASFGMPVVSTWGSGSAVELVEPEYLATPESPESLLAAIRRLAAADKEAVGRALMEKAMAYNIEHSAQVFLQTLGIE